jgi:very-short-patch-repair endonuclease
MKRVPAKMTTNARALRNGATFEERALWHQLSRYRPKFTRQLVIAPYIPDFACREAKLVVELDGSQHLDTTVYDETRSTYLARQGWKVVRYWNGDIRENLDGVVQQILSEAAECLSGTHPQPLPFREGRKREPRSRT